MGRQRARTPSRVHLAAERRAALVKRLVDHSIAEFDEPLSPFRAEALLDLILGDVGASLYNQGVRDAIAGLQPKLVDLEAEISEAEPER